MHTYCILDGARMLIMLDQAKALNQDSISLYAGLPLEVLESISPYIFYLDPNSYFPDWVFTEGWGKSWGIYVRTKVNGEELFHHFRKFITVFTEQGKELYFRFYDPRALRIFLPTCSNDQLREFFGPVESFFMEDKSQDVVLCFTLQGNKLVSTRENKGDWFAALFPYHPDEEVKSMTEIEEDEDVK